MRLTLKEGDNFHDRYRIERRLGAGGSGEVYLAVQLDVNRKVALKLLEITTERKKSLDRFLREFKLLASLSHHNIVTFYSAAISAEGVPYAVCEYVNGKSLHATLQDLPRMPWTRVARIAMQVCDAMQYAHTNSVIHRDLKPDNIMLVDTPEPDTVKIIDFGLGKDLEDTAQKLTNTGMLMGTPHYMSPEQALGDAAAVDARADIYALACIMYECLCGRKLFDAFNPLGILHKQASEDPVPILELSFPPESAAIAGILEKMLAKSPDQRYQTMEELRQDIEKISNQDLPVGSVVDTEDADFPGTKRSFPTKVVIIVLVFVGIIAAASVLKINSSKEESLASIPIRKEPAPNQVTKREASLEEQLTRYEQRLIGEKDPERRKALIDMFFRRGKELRFEQGKKERNGMAAKEITVRRMLKYCPEMDDASLLHADLLRELAYFQLEKEDLAGAIKYCDEGLKVLEGQHDEATEYILRLVSAKTKILLKDGRFQDAQALVNQFDQYLGIPGKDLSNPMYARFPSVKVEKKKPLEHECLEVTEVLRKCEYKDDAQRILAIEMLLKMADYLIRDGESKATVLVLNAASDFVDLLADQDTDERKKFRSEIKDLRKLNEASTVKPRTIL